ncbi:hypothetical protein HPB52_017553 [Rhipicephalus sanguineus]|uniref:Uncharacterized protein n=1 Tax=Rhipicephalus sanguineus TaxID=34632 RepID=A0A9D4SPZ5_RHISA|nr:hypothetical protein HPB52_017553 [Rhipicephalus sanguineus]
MRDQLYHVVLLVTFSWLGSAVAGPLEKPEKGDKEGSKQTIQEFFTSDWGACEPLKNPLVIPEMSDPQTWIRCQKHLPEHPSDIEEYLPRLSRCMLKSTGWVRSNGNMNLSKYLQYLSLLGLDNEYKETDFKTQDKLYVECIFKHFTKVRTDNAGCESLEDDVLRSFRFNRREVNVAKSASDSMSSTDELSVESQGTDTTARSLIFGPSRLAVGIAKDITWDPLE